jgi:hypothetical protein
MDTASIHEAISAIQERACDAIGWTIYDVRDHHLAEQERVRNYLADKPDFLRPRHEVLEADSTLAYIEYDLPSRFDTIVPKLPYQHPYHYTFLCDYVRYFNSKLGRPGDASLIIATAPTGRFNAIAVQGKDENGIIIEDGLLNVANSFAANVSLLLYNRLNTSQYQPLLVHEIRDAITKRPDIIQSLTGIIWDYVVDGYSVLTNTASPSYKDDFSVRHILFQGFLFFVIEHERFHIALWKKDPASNNSILSKAVNQDLWDFYTAHLAQHLPAEGLTKEEFNTICLVQTEEMFADIFGLAEVMNLGTLENDYEPSLDGALLFFLIAELIQFLLYRLDDSIFADHLYTQSATVLSLTSIVQRQTHPYTTVRKSSLLSYAKSTFPAYHDSIETCMQKVDCISEKIREQIDLRLSQMEASPAPHPKWIAGKALMQ